jgi:hypothetical protein
MSKQHPRELLLIFAHQASQPDRIDREGLLANVPVGKFRVAATAAIVLTIRRTARDRAMAWLAAARSVRELAD